jgi:hypothetical protein
LYVAYFFFNKYRVLFYLGGQNLFWGEGKGVAPVVGEGGGERSRRMNTVQIMYIHYMYTCIYMYVNAKMIPVETIPGICGEGMKERGRGGELKYYIFDIL